MSCLKDKRLVYLNKRRGNMKYLLFILCFSTSGYAADWYCREVASQWAEKGKVLAVCGIGSGSSEDAARLNAYNSAQKEFSGVCHRNTTCGTRVVNVDPQRSQCDLKKGVFVCYRLFYYHITSQERKDVNVLNVKVYNQVHNHYNTTVIKQAPARVNGKLLDMYIDSEMKLMDVELELELYE